MTILDNKTDALTQLCDVYQVDKLFLFGSALNANFKKSSDIDFLVKFKPIDLYNYYDNYSHFKEKLRKLFNREIDLVEEQTLKNPILIKSINQSKQLIYG